MSNVSRVYYAPLTKGQLMDLAIQVRFKGIDYLRVGGTAKKGCRLYHGNLFEGLLGELNVDFHMREDDEGPIAVKEGVYELRGAGQCWFNPKDTHQFRGGSAGYDKRLNIEDLRGIVPFFPKGICVKIIHPVEDSYIDLGVGEGRK